MPCCLARQFAFSIATIKKTHAEIEKQHEIPTLEIAAIRCGALKHNIVHDKKIEKKK